MNMTRVLCIAATLTGTLVVAQPALADTWSGAYDGTIVSTYTDGRVVNVYVNPDHTYSVALPDGKILKGSWADNATQSCFTLTNPAPAAGAKPSCFPLKTYKVGDTLHGEDSSGKFTGILKAGR